MEMVDWANLVLEQRRLYRNICDARIIAFGCVDFPRLVFQLGWIEFVRDFYSARHRETTRPEENNHSVCSLSHAISVCPF